MDSFYGGLNGQDFNIKEIFNTYEDLLNDLSKGWTSPISPSEFVVISYGMPNEPGYSGYRDRDLLKFGKTYNSTLWRKEYNQKANGNANGLNYKPIASMTGNTPEITIEKGLPVNADEDPEIAIDHTDIDNPHITIRLPKGQVINFQGSLDLRADESPEVIWDDTDINHPDLQINLPVSQVLQEATVEEVLPAMGKPSVRLDYGTQDETGNWSNINNPSIKFKLPQSQTWLETTDENPKAVGLDVLDADKQPTATLTAFKDDEGIIHQDIKVLNLGLPRAQVMNKNPLMIDGTNSTTIPLVELVGEDEVEYDVNHPRLKITLPRAAEFKIDLYDSTKIPAQYGLAPGDFLLDSLYGNLYEVQADETFGTPIRLQVTKPEIPKAISISPYEQIDDTWVATNPSVVGTVIEENKENKWILQFSLPKIPTIQPEVPVETIASTEMATAQVAIADANSLKFSFSIPRGSRLFTGVNTSIIADALSGDYFLNSDDGILYQYDGEIWFATTTDLTGPIGPALNIVAKIDIAAASLTFDEAIAAIRQKDPGPYSAENIYAVTWTDTGNNNIQSSYWYYCIDPTNPDSSDSWGRAILTGNVEGFLEREYIVGQEADEKAYNAAYINTLINDEAFVEDRTLKTYSARYIDAAHQTLNQNMTELQNDVNQQLTDKIEEINTIIDAAKTDFEAEIATIDEKISWGSFADLITTT